MKPDNQHEVALTADERNVMPLRKSDELQSIDPSGYMAVINARAMSDRASMDASTSPAARQLCEERIALARVTALGLLDRLGLGLPKQ